MIIIKITNKIIILYFIQITHTDDFPSTGTRLVMVNTADNIWLLDSDSSLYVFINFFISKPVHPQVMRFL